MIGWPAEAGERHVVDGHGPERRVEPAVEPRRRAAARANRRSVSAQNASKSCGLRPRRPVRAGWSRGRSKALIAGVIVARRDRPRPAYSTLVAVT